MTATPAPPVARPAAVTARGRRTRAQLVTAASAALTASGRVEVTDVATRAGVSLGLLYRYFPSKHELAGAIIDAFYDEYDAAVFVVAAEPGVDWFDAERRRLEREVDFLYDHPIAATVLASPLAEPGAAHADAMHHAHHVAMAARNIRAGQRRGAIDGAVDARLAGAAFIGALRAAVGDALTRSPRPARRRLVDAVWAMGSAVIRRAGRPGRDGRAG